MGMTMVLSPLIGGVISHWPAWRWAFFISLPACGAVLASGARTWRACRRDDGKKCRLAPKPAEPTIFSAQIGATAKRLQFQLGHTHRNLHHAHVQPKQFPRLFSQPSVVDPIKPCMTNGRDRVAENKKASL